MTAGRFLSGIISSKLSPKQIIIIGECITFIALLLIIAPLNIAFATLGLFMIGFGNGPLFPNMTHLVPAHFGTELSQSLIGLQMAASSVSVLLSPILFGQIAEHSGLHLFPYVLMLMLILTASATLRLFLKGRSPLADVNFK